MDTGGPHVRLEVLERVLTQWPEDHRDRIATVVELQGDLLGQHASGWCLFPAEEAGHWVTAMNDTEGERRARETIEAFVGPLTGSLSTSGRPTNESRPGEAWLKTQGAGQLLDLAPGDDEGQLLGAIELLVTVRADQPPANRDVVEPLQFLIREFYLALYNQDSEASRDLLRRVEATGRLDHRNLQFLRIERLARLEQWNELIQLDEFDALAVARRPRRISEHLLEAIWHARIVTGDLSEPKAIRNRFQEQGVTTSYRPLLVAVDVPSPFGARCVVALFCREANDPDRLGRVVEFSTQSERESLNQLVGSLLADQFEQEPVTPTGLGDSPVAACQTAFNNCDYKKVVDIAEENRDRTECLPLAVRAAAESGDRELCSRVTDLVDPVSTESLPEAEQFSLLLERVNQIAAHRCIGWADWLERISGNEPWPMGAEVLRDYHKAWDIDELLLGSMPKRAAELLVEGISGVNKDQLRNVLSVLCELSAVLARNPAARPIQLAILLLLSDDDNPSEQVRDAFLELSAACLDGADVDTYKDLLEIATEIWRKVKSPQTVGWGLDFADQLVDFPSPDSTLREGFLNELTVFAHQPGARLDYEDRNWLTQLLEETENDAQLPPEPEVPEEEFAPESLWDRLVDKQVGLYTLKPQPRFEIRLKKLCPEIAGVETNSAKRADPRLTALAQRSDYMIVACQCAKHPATECIDEVRDRERQLFPEGRGCPGVSTLIRCLKKALQAELDAERER